MERPVRESVPSFYLVSHIKSSEHALEAHSSGGGRENAGYEEDEALTAPTRKPSRLPRDIQACNRAM